MNTKEENKKLLEMYAPLRVADVRDGMDWLGYHHYGTLDRDIRPLWRTRVCGIAEPHATCLMKALLRFFAGTRIPNGAIITTIP